MNKERFVIIADYKLDKYILGTAIQIIFLSAMFGIFFALKSAPLFSYYECIEGPIEHPLYCDNPYYRPTTWENSLILPIGQYGYIPWLVKYSWTLASLLLLLAILLNHFIHNGGYKIDYNKINIEE